MWSRRAFCWTAAALPVAAQQTPPARESSGREELPAGPIPPLDASGPYAGKSWALQYSLDEEEGGALLNGLGFANSRCGIAVGAALRHGRPEPFFLVTRDGGRGWAQVRSKDFLLSICVVDEKRAYAVGDEALWFSSDGGETWHRRDLPKMRHSKSLRTVRVHFSDELHGFAYGTGKLFHRTKDGGRSWEVVRESAAIELKDENTAWNGMVWMTERAGMLVGHSAAPHKEALAVPDWMLPERGVRRRLLPATTVLAETRDGGESWAVSLSSTFGRAYRMRAAGLKGLTLFDFGDGFEFASEVYEIDIRSGKSHSLFRRRDLVVGDGALLSGGGVILAGIEPHGRLRSAPVPGRPRFVYSPDGRSFFSMKADYRAVGRQIELAYVDDQNIWAATDEGFILKLG